MTRRTVPTRSFSRQRQQGYMLLSLSLIVSLLVIAAAAAAPAIAFQIKRDREDELIYRAAQYRRAIRRFTQQTGRFPMTLDDLDNTNGVRFLRKRYKDPMTGKDFRLLHMGDLAAATGVTSGNTSSSNGASDNQNASDPSTSAPDQAATPEAAQPAQPNSGSNASQNRAQAGPSASVPENSTFGGGVIIGVASTSTKKTIREFDHKNHYNQWLFFYSPTFDRGFEVRGPTSLSPVPAHLQGPQNSAGQQSQPGGPQPLSATPQQ